MDTIEPESKLAGRAIAIPTIWRFAFWSIVAAEGVTAVLFTGGRVELWRARMSPSRDFHRAKRFRVRGRGRRVPHLVRRLRAVGGEWFAMWQSEVWNGQQPAFRICVFILLCTLIVGQKEYDG
jgi:predicted small integral membrane protein